MNRAIGNTTDLALEAAADLILDNPPEPPPTPSINQLCKAVGIGASTFYRLYDDAEEFRQALAVHSILASYEPGRRAVLEKLEIQTDGADSDQSISEQSASEQPATQQPAPGRTASAEPASTTEEERAALMGTLSQTFQDTGVRRDALEAAYLPWLHNPSIASALRQSFEIASTDYEEIADSFLNWAGRSAIATATPDDIMRRILSVVLACDLVPTKSTWTTKASQGVPTVIYAHVNLVEALSEPS